MIDLNLFIVGMEKSGTTTLANWIVENGFAKYRIPNVKEPCIYANNDFVKTTSTINDGILLDASVAYATNPSSIDRMPEHNTKIILCLRNQFERSFSAYRQYKIICQKNHDSLNIKQRFPTNTVIGKKLSGESGAFFLLMHMIKLHYPRISDPHIEKYIYREAQNILDQNFHDRINYEIGFFLSRREFPFFSILNNSFYTYPLKNILSKYLNKDLCILTLGSLEDKKIRQKFIETVFEKESVEVSPKIPKIYSLKDIEIGEACPDFSESRWDVLRSYFRQDLENFYQIMKERKFETVYIIHEELSRYLYP